MSSKLREAREEAGYTVEEVAEQLNIRKQYIICLEEGNFEDIPGKVYVKGYTKMYSEFLGIKAPNKVIYNTKQVPEANINSQQQKVKRKYIVFLSAMMLILVILVYSMMKSSKVKVVEVVEDELIQNIQEQNGNNEEEFD